MGKKIDGFVLTLLFATVLFFYFLNAFENSILSIILSLLATCLARKFLGQCIRILRRTGWFQKRCLRRSAKETLVYLACMDTEEATERMNGLLKKCYQIDTPLVFVQLHPAHKLSGERIFEAWRHHQGTDHLVICTTGSCSDENKTFASTLKNPKVAVVDASLLSRMLAEHPEEVYSSPHEPKRRSLRAKHILQLFLNRRNAPRCLLFSLSMLVMYIFSGNPYYLVFSLFLVFIACISLRHAPRPVKLF